MNIFLTTDADFITRCVLQNWDWLRDDGADDKDFYFPLINEHVQWARAEDYGVFMLTRCNFVTFECHTALLQNARGKAVEIGKAALKFAFENTPALRIITAVPENNTLALRMALKSGFTQYGINPGSFMKNGVLLSQTLLGINKGDITCQL